MPNAKYRAGADLERAAKNYLQVNGYLVIKSAGSKGCADLVALKPGPAVVLVQAKTDGYLTPAERRDLLGAAELIGALALAVRWRKDGRAARTVEFAELTGLHPNMTRPWTPDYAMETT
jgi:Holliday junction resolvase